MVLSFGEEFLSDFCDIFGGEVIFFKDFSVSFIVVESVDVEDFFFGVDVFMLFERGFSFDVDLFFYFGG